MEVPAVRIDVVGHRYGAFKALEGVSFEVRAGDLFGLLGPNGSGKTTLFRAISTLLRPTSGSLRVFGEDPIDHPERVRPLLGVIFQEPALDAELRVDENLLFHGSLYGLRGPALRERIHALLELFGMADRRSSRVKTLSGGQKRRIDLIRGLLHQPRLLLLDEPTTGLDPLARRTFWDVLHQLRRREGVTMIVTTHLLDEAEACDDIAVLSRGRLLASGAPDTLKSRLGDDVLWLRVDDPETLAPDIASALEVATEVVGHDVRITGAAAVGLLPALYERYGDRITSATVRKPTLEDVFMVLAGHHMEEQA